MWRWLVAVGLALERFTHERWLVFVVVTFVALIPATIIYDQANRSTQGVRSLAANLGERLLTPSAHAAGPDTGPTALENAGKPIADPRLREVVATWPRLSPELQEAVLAVVKSARPDSVPPADGAPPSPSAPSPLSAASKSRE